MEMVDNLRNWAVGLCLACIGGGAFAAPPTAEQKSAFLAQGQLRLTWEITVIGSKKFDETPEDANSGLAYRINRTIRGFVPLNMAMPGSFPQSSMPLSQQQMMEAGRFIGWMASPSEEQAAVAMAQLESGKVDPATNPTMLPVEYAIDDVAQRRYQEDPSVAATTQTYTMKGKGTAYIPLSGMVLCDLTKMTCDINNVLLRLSEGTDRIVTTLNSDQRGFDSRTENETPQRFMPELPASIASWFKAFPITLPLPATHTFTARAPDLSISGPIGEPGPLVSLKVTLTPSQ